MSPTLLAICRRVDLDTRRLVGTGDRETGATYPRDYFRGAEFLWLWRGAGRFFYSPEQMRTPSVNVCR
jgi:hypothetical protein